MDGTVIILIEGGMLRGVYTAPGQEVSVELVDVDNINAGDYEAPLDLLNKNIKEGKVVNCW